MHVELSILNIILFLFLLGQHLHAHMQANIQGPVVQNFWLTQISV